MAGIARKIESYNLAYRLAWEHISEHQRREHPDIAQRLHDSIRRQVSEEATEAVFIASEVRSGILRKACREQESHKGSGRMPANIRPPLTTTFFSSISKHTNIGTRCSGGMKVRRPAGLPLHLALLPPHLALPLRLARRSTRRLLRGKSRRKFTKTTPQMILCPMTVTRPKVKNGTGGMS
jgi:hypothetical protein